ncbi:MAG: succinate dehydrogenase assembly factor 2 [Pseudotabrizicola sp.]|uniref:FAD assembly factor SdhE n=1 Tax=Pseudotabrizicola sp. TaxID=2939647 RepID=UPI0027301850|nr:succinate dehydrogenase assembly factor 2 [Pseudotabrizicola sp.]MDP2080428.1 succinate dehydrogenase assembly factor 2 [Pseudotabrizicola sp.]MDZ7573728.1 succinate dehydrogenase assembly factor 2 [Pseudotabrizicola sp.]
MIETPEARLKRMKMRSWRRGTKEMDLVLGPWADAHLDGLSAAELEEYEVLLAENDQDLMSFIFEQAQPAPLIAPLLAKITTFARDRLRKV